MDKIKRFARALSLRERRHGRGRTVRRRLRRRSSRLRRMIRLKIYVLSANRGEDFFAVFCWNKTKIGFHGDAMNENSKKESQK